MFEEGTYVVYGNKGVCKVESVGTMKGKQMSRDTLYYTLAPVYMSGSRLYTPVTAMKTVMRKIMTKEEVTKLIEEISSLEQLWIPDEREREKIYKEAVRSCDCRELVRIIKTLYLRKESRLADGKKVTAVDEKYFHMAEEQLYGEMALPLEIDKAEVEAYIADKMH